MTNTTPYEELLTFAGDYRVKLATETTIVYERLGQSKYPSAPRMSRSWTCPKRTG